CSWQMAPWMSGEWWVPKTPPTLQDLRFVVGWVESSEPTTNRSILVILTRPIHRRQEIIQFRQFLGRPHDPEADRISIGHPPDALRLLWVALEPGFVRAAAGRGAALGRLIGPRPAADHVRILDGGRLTEWVQHESIGRFQFVVSGRIMIDAPLGDVADHVVES